MSSSHTDEYLVRVPKYVSKKYNVMRFNSGDKVDIRDWVKGSLSRDISSKKIFDEDELYPEFGEGSEYGRKRKEEARRLKYGYRAKKFNIQDQPWNLVMSAVETQQDTKKKLNGKNDTKPKLVTKEFAGRKEGGIGEGSVYFVFTQHPDSTFEAHAVEDWYNFRRKIQHRTLTDEEVEEAWGNRDKIVNHLNYMARKRLHIDDDDEEADDVKQEKKKIVKKGAEKSSNLLIHDNEDYDLYMSESSSGGDEESGPSQTKKPKRRKRKKSQDSENEKEEAIEDSDDGEHEGTEIAYASDVSSENEEITDSKVVPRGLDELTSSSSSEDEEGNERKTDDQASQNTELNKSNDSDISDASADLNSDIEDDEHLSQSALFMQQKGAPKEKRSSSKKVSSKKPSPTPELSGSSNTSVRSKMENIGKKLKTTTGRQSPSTSKSISNKRSACESNSEVPIKRLKLIEERSRSNTPTKDTSQHGITEDAVRKYLTHKPITTKDLLKKFKKNKTGLSSEQIVEKVAKMLKKLNPQKSNINGKMHLYMKAN